MKLNLDSERIDIPCPRCGKKFTQTLGWFKSHRNFTCPGCGTSTKVDTTKFDKGVAEAQKSIDKLDAAFRKLGKR